MSVSKHDGPSSRPVSLTGENQRDKRDRIIERAIIMFNQVGYDRVRVSDITDSLGMGKGTFYLYFQNKKALLLSCFEHVGELLEELEALPGIREGDFFSKVGPRVESIGRTYWFPGLVNLLRGAELSHDPEVKRKARQAYDMIAHYLKLDLREAIDAGRARDVDVELAVYGFIGLAENLWFRSRLDGTYAPEDVVRFAVDATTRLYASSIPRAEEKPPSIANGARLVCRDGMEVPLADIRFNGVDHVSGKLGFAIIEVEAGQAAALAVAETGEECIARIVTTDGSELVLRIDGSTPISGNIPAGRLSIALRDVSTIEASVRTE